MNNDGIILSNKERRLHPIHPKMFRKTSSNNWFLAPNFIPTQTRHPVVPRKGKIKIDATVVWVHKRWSSTSTKIVSFESWHLIYGQLFISFACDRDRPTCLVTMHIKHCNLWTEGKEVSVSVFDWCLLSSIRCSPLSWSPAPYFWLPEMNVTFVSSPPPFVYLTSVFSGPILLRSVLFLLD